MEHQEEIWRTLKCFRPKKRRLDVYENYEINEYGDIRSKKTKLILKTFIDRDGYVHASPKIEKGKGLDCPVHIAVATTFIGIAPKGCDQVNHKDENKENNHISNVEWCDAKYNNSYGTGTARRSKAKINGKRARKTAQLDPIDKHVIKIWPSTMEIERVLGFPNAQVSCACHHGTKCRGYYFEFV